MGPQLCRDDVRCVEAHDPDPIGTMDRTNNQIRRRRYSSIRLLGAVRARFTVKTLTRQPEGDPRETDGKKNTVNEGFPDLN